MNKFHKLAMLALSLALVIGLVACPNKTEPKPEPEPTPGPGPVVPTPGPDPTPVVPTPEPYTILDAGTDGTAGTEATYVTFGEWPQSVLPEGTTVTVSDTETKVVGMFTYYKGDDGNWYVKQEEKAYDTGDAYKYSDGTTVNQGGTATRYFQVEPIKWRVLEEAEGKKFLLAEVGLMALPYYDNSNERTIDGNTICSNNYMHSKIRAWLNGYKYQLDDAENSQHETNGFLQTAFTSAAQNKIATTTVDNSVESTGYSSNPYFCEDTGDKVFLLSTKEATIASYGFSESTGADNARIRKPTDFALATGAYNWADDGVWWLRSPSSDNHDGARRVNRDGGVYNQYFPVLWGGCAVVPALWLIP